jgi:hypothetical protein
MGSLDANKGASFWNSSLPDATVPTRGAIHILSLRHSMTMFRISDTIRRTETADGGILLDVHHGQMFCLNLVGAKILELMHRGYEESRIADEISRYYGVDNGVVCADLAEFVKTLSKQRILLDSPPTDTT